MNTEEITGEGLICAFYGTVQECYNKLWVTVINKKRVIL